MTIGMLVNFAKFRLFIRIGVSKYDIGLTLNYTLSRSHADTLTR